MDFQACSSATLLDRPDLIDTVFTSCDRDRDMHLNEEELLMFARLFDEEFDGRGVEWDQIYHNLCAAFGWSPDEGVDHFSFIDFVDREDSGCYCNDELLQWMAHELAPVAKLQASPIYDDVPKSTGRRPTMQLHVASHP